MIEDGKTVRVHFTGTLEDGSVFGSTVGDEPLEFTLGSEQVLPGFEEEVKKMEVGDARMVTFQPEDAYGPHIDEMVLKVDRDRLPPNPNLAVGQRLEKQMENGEMAVLVVIDFDDTTITFDANHPLAGQALTFKIELLEVH